MSQVQSVRYGFATNSSSTHSIIINKNHKIKDRLGDHFGWDFFTAVSQQAKKQYLASILQHHFVPIVGQAITRDLINCWLKIDVQDVSLCLGIDHQSMPIMPMDWNEKGLNVDFFNDYKSFILDEHLAILGGNDNTLKKHSLAKKYDPFVLPILYDHTEGCLVARKDPDRGYWTLFNRKTGTKVRVFLGKDQPKITKAFAPELVDLKITDYCSHRCGFCYQGSTVNGQHGSTQVIDQILYTLSQHQVFEVALGGGEPTDHPKFESILSSCQMYHIVPNFTTKTLNWLKDDTRRDQILSKIGGFAYSVTNGREVRELGFLLEKYQIKKDRVQVQIVDGLISDWAFSSILKECSYHGITLTILGFKITGRGAEFAAQRQPYQYDWISMVQKFREQDEYITIGVDTLMVQKYQDRFKEEGIDEIFFTPEEGQFSCYIDAVTQQMGPSSYAPEQMTSFTGHELKTFIQTFNSY